MSEGARLESVKVHIPQADRQRVAQFLLAAAEHPWDVASVSEGYVITGELWDLELAGATVGHFLQLYADNPALPFPDVMTAQERTDAAARALAPDSGSTPAQADEVDEADSGSRKPARATKAKA